MSTDGEVRRKGRGLRVWGSGFESSKLWLVRSTGGVVAAWELRDQGVLWGLERLGQLGRLGRWVPGGKLRFSTLGWAFRIRGSEFPQTSVSGTKLRG